MLSWKLWLNERIATFSLLTRLWIIESLLKLSFLRSWLSGLVTGHKNSVVSPMDGAPTEPNKSEIDQSRPKDAFSRHSERMMTAMERGQDLEAERERSLRVTVVPGAQNVVK